MAEKFLSEAGLAYYDGKMKERLAKKADADAVPTKTSELQNDSGYITGADVPEGAAASTTVPKMDGAASAGAETAFARGDHVHPTDTSRLGTAGDGSQVTVSFNPAADRGAPESGETLAVIMGRLAKNFADLGALAYRDGIGKDDLDAAIRASLAKADTALQSFTETDPTVPAWAKEPSKPTYTAAEVGAIPAAQADTFARKSDLSSVYKYKGSVATAADLPAADNEVGDVWNVEATDMNYGWTGEAWDPLGQIFEIQALSNEEISTIMDA
ncbi:MAG: hypothetical protein K2K53_11850 [Oscillospiraceae bacterium]|nr:hypothetical protein [Oscillospiraceae bacterium]